MHCSSNRTKQGRGALDYSGNSCQEDELDGYYFTNAIIQLSETQIGVKKDYTIDHWGGHRWSMGLDLSLIAF
jgi:hypothetical protein